MSTTNPFEAIRTEPDHTFWEGQGISFESEVEGVRCTTGFMNPGTYTLSPEQDEYIILHDGELILWEEYHTPKEGWGGTRYSSMAPCLTLRGGTKYLTKIVPRDELFWNEQITQNETVTYTCFYPEDDTQMATVRTIMKAQEHAVTRYMHELRGEIPPTDEELNARDTRSYDQTLGFDV